MLKKISVIESAMKTNPWMSNIEDSNKEKIIGSLYEKDLVLSKLKISYYSEPDGQVRDKSKQYWNFHIMLLKKN